MWLRAQSASLLIIKLKLIVEMSTVDVEIVDLSMDTDSDCEAPDDYCWLAVVVSEDAPVNAAPPPPKPTPAYPECGVCMYAMTPDSMWAGKCGHVYCLECLTKAAHVSKKCPTCRSSLTKRQMRQIFFG